MISGKCSNPDCTVSETGICLESHQNLKECPNFKLIEEEMDQPSSNQHQEPEINNKPQLSSISLARQFHAGNELGIEDILCISQKRYTYIVGVLGSVNVGKTCLLSSLYLLTSQGDLSPDYLFAGSLTLPGFEDRVRHLRTWDALGLPDQFVEHTQLQNPRQPAFMHLCLLERTRRERIIDLLISDLPGEWTDKLIDNADASDRFNFLRRADCIFYVIDGPKLDCIETKNVEVYRTTLAIDRLINNVGIDVSIPFIFLISKCDEIDMKLPSGFSDILDHAKLRHLSPSVVMTVAFSKKPRKYSSGNGILELINLALIKKSIPSEFKKEKGDRSFWSF